MKVKQLHLQNYGRFEDLTIDFAPLNEKQKNVTVIMETSQQELSEVKGIGWGVARTIYKVLHE